MPLLHYLLDVESSHKVHLNVESVLIVQFSVVDLVVDAYICLQMASPSSRVSLGDVVEFTLRLVVLGQQLRTESQNVTGFDHLRSQPAATTTHCTIKHLQLVEIYIPRE